MVNAIFSQLRYSRVVSLLLAIIVLFPVPCAVAQTQSQDANSSSSPSTPPDAAAKAAERKKRFEEEEKRLENAEDQHSLTESVEAADNDLAISPVLVNMLVHETQGFSLFDNAGHNLTSKAEWTLSNSDIADLTTNGTPTITTKDSGTVTVRARVGNKSTEASVIVHSGNKLPIGTIRWQAPKTGTFKTQQIVIAAH
jgi:hypothetical protein